VSDVARQYYLAGGFGRAAELFSEAAKGSLDPVRRFQLAEQAYYAYGTTGRIREAQAILKDFKPIASAIDTECSACMRLGSSATTQLESRDKLKALTMQHAIFASAIRE
jgi:hypothetical protein